MNEIFKLADELGPAKIIHVYEPSVNLKAVLVVDNVAAGPAIGGVRMAPDVTTEECVRLVNNDFKECGCRFTSWGGQSRALRRPEHAQGRQRTPDPGYSLLPTGGAGIYFQPDMGTDEMCMSWINDEIGRAAGLLREVGGIPLDEIGATGWGVSHAADVALQLCGYLCDFRLEKARIVVQGFGAVGKHAARFLAARQGILVGVADSRISIIRIALI